MVKIRILLADDSKTMQAVIKTCLNDQLYELRIATDGYEAISAIREFAPEVVLLDIMMPGKSGYQVLKEVREAERMEKPKNKTAIVMVSGLSDKNDIADCIKLGIQGYLVKPFKPEEIAERVENALSQKRRV